MNVSLCILPAMGVETGDRVDLNMPEEKQQLPVGVARLVTPTSETAKQASSPHKPSPEPIQLSAAIRFSKRQWLFFASWVVVSGATVLLWPHLNRWISSVALRKSLGAVANTLLKGPLVPFPSGFYDEPVRVFCDALASGFVFGIAQWLVIRTRLSKAGSWVVACIASPIIADCVWRFWPGFKHYPSGGVIFVLLVASCCAAFPQWLVLKKHVAMAWTWFVGVLAAHLLAFGIMFISGCSSEVTQFVKGPVLGFVLAMLVGQLQPQPAVAPAAPLPGVRLSWLDAQFTRMSPLGLFLCAVVPIAIPLLLAGLIGCRDLQARARVRKLCLWQAGQLLLSLFLFLGRLAALHS